MKYIPVVLVGKKADVLNKLKNMQPWVWEATKMTALQAAAKDAGLVKACIITSPQR